MTDWNFRILNAANGDFEIVNAMGADARRGSASPNSGRGFSALTGGSVSINRDRTIRVLVTCDNGRIAEFKEGRAAGNLDFVGFV